jgi:ribosomal protein S17E
MNCKRAILQAIFVTMPLIAGAQSKNCFLIGSSQSLVKKVQGVPKSIYKQDGLEIWSYGESSISFEDGLVTEYDNYSKNLRICKELTPVASKELQERQGYILPERSRSKASKAATQEWVLEKLNQYVEKNIYTEGYYSTNSHKQYPGKTQKNTSFSIEGNDLVVRYTVDDSRRPYEESYKIPISDLRRLHNDMGKLVLTTKSNSIEYRGLHESTDNNTFTVKFDFATEADIKQRLVSAFAHLQKLSKTGKKKEVF